MSGLVLLLESPRFRSAKRFLVSAQNVRVGRGARCDLRIPLATLSSHHFTLRQRGSGWEVRDERSTNGTALESARLEPGAWVRVASGQRVRAPSLSVRVIYDGARPPAEDGDSFTLESSTLAMRQMAHEALAGPEDPDGAYLEGTRGPMRGRRFFVPEGGKPLTIGPGGTCGARIEIEGAQGAVCAIELRQESFWCEPLAPDLISVHGVPLAESGGALRSGDVIQVGAHEFVFRDPIEALVGALDEPAGAASRATHPGRHPALSEASGELAAPTPDEEPEEIAPEEGGEEAAPDQRSAAEPSALGGTALRVALAALIIAIVIAAVALIAILATL